MSRTVAIEQAASDTTPPTLPVDPSLSIATTKDQATVDFDKATGDDTDATTALIYRLWRAPAGADISTAALCNSNGAEVASGTDVAQLVDSAVPKVATPYEWNVTVEDTTGNQVAYTQTQFATKLGSSSPVLDGQSNPVQGARVRVDVYDNSNLDTLVASETLTTDAQGEFEMSADYDETRFYVVWLIYFNVVDSGTAESGDADTLTDTDKAWTASEFNSKEYYLRFTGGTGSGQERVVDDNDTDSLFPLHSFSPAPDATTQYELGILQSDIIEVHPVKG